MSAVRSNVKTGLVGAAAALVLAAGSMVALAAATGHLGSGSNTAASPSMTDGYGPGMMGGAGAGPGGAMMGAGALGPGRGLGMAGTWQGGGRYGLAGDGRAVTTMAAAKARAQAFADQLGGGLHAGEVMQFSNGYYSELLTSAGTGATEVLIDPGSGAVSIEYGPAMMWNTEYGMRATGRAAATVSPAQAVTDAQAWLDAQHTGLTAGEATTFPGYYTLHTLNGSKIVGMMSINATTGAAWYHSWHGTFLGMVGE